MSDVDPAACCISGGPRAAALTEALGHAEQTLAAPFTDDELEIGWTDELRETLVSDLYDVTASLASGGPTDDLFRAWDMGSSLDEADDDPRWDAVVRADGALRDFERAEAGLRAARVLEEQLNPMASHADLRNGFDDAVRSKLRAAVGVIASRLAEGAYLTDDDVDPWVALLAAFGMVRREPDEAPDAMRTFIEVGKVETFPSGHRWEQVVLCDNELMDVAMIDLYVDEP